uniref:Uncharacterized protein n=1 Tax=Glossina austeni TaxID=7395 RepID=A0A1A9VLJ1_GLOAU
MSLCIEDGISLLPNQIFVNILLMIKTHLHSSHQQLILFCEFCDFATAVVVLAAAGEGVSSGNECKCTVDEAIVTQDALVSKVEEVEGVNEAVDELTIAIKETIVLFVKTVRNITKEASNSDNDRPIQINLNRHKSMHKAKSLHHYERWRLVKSLNRCLALYE